MIYKYVSIILSGLSLSCNTYERIKAFHNPRQNKFPVLYITFSCTAHSLHQCIHIKLTDVLSTLQGPDEKPVK